jgi:hypothetical protein
MSFPPATEMFQFTGFASRAYGFSAGYPLRGGLPHSEIPGSTIARISPGLFAACHVLHRLSVPRHPPDALVIVRSTMSFSRPGPRPALAGTHGPFLRPALAGTPKKPEPALAGKPKRHPGKPPRTGTSTNRGANPNRDPARRLSPAARRSHEDTSSERVGTQARLRPEARPPRSHSQIRFTCQSTPAPEPATAGADPCPPGRPGPGNKTWSSPNALRNLRCQRSELRGQRSEPRGQRSGRRPAVPAVEMPEWR